MDSLCDPGENVLFLSERRDARNLENVNYVNRFYGSIDINLRPREARKIIQISRNLFVNGNRFRAGRHS